MFLEAGQGSTELQVGWDVRDDEVGDVVRGTKFKVRDEEKQS